MYRLISFLLIATMGLTAIILTDNYYRGGVRQANTQALQQAVQDVRGELAQSIAARITVAEDLQAFMLARASLPDYQTFDRFAALLMDHYPQVFTVMYVDPDRVIRHIYPLAGNESALDLDLNTRPAAPFVEKAIQERRLTVNNPTVTVQGALSVIPRVPLYREDELLGLVQVVVEIEPVLKEATRNLDERVQFQLRDATGALFWGPETLGGETASATIPVGDNFWTLTAGWLTAPPAPDAFVLMLIWGSGGVLLLGVLVIVNQIWSRTQWLRQAVAERTKELEAEIAQRHLAEEKLRGMNLRLEHILKASPLPILGADADGHITSWNNAAERLLGWNENEVVGNIGPMVSPEEMPDYLELIRRTMQGETITGQARFCQKDDGSRLVCSIYAAPQINEHGQTIGVTLILEDITERRQAEEKIERQLNRLKGLRRIDLAISSSFDIHITLEVVLQQVISQLNADAAVILLFDPQIKKLEHAASLGFRSDAIRHTHLKIGEGYAGRAVLERKTIHIPDLVENADQPANVVQLEKESFADYYGTPLIVKGEVKGVLEIYQRSRLDPGPDWLEFLETLAGQAAIAIDNAQLFQNLQRANAELEHRVAERTAELNQINLELQHANQTKVEFLATMSHELRTPLNSILGLSESLLEQRRGPLNEDQQKSLQIVESSGHHLLELINDVLDLSKIEAGKLDFYPEVIILDEISQSSLAFVRGQAAKKAITISYERDEAVSKIYADPRRLKQILVNLLSNAVKFTPDHGRVTLQVRADAEQDLLQFSVIDTGIGISPEDLERLFQPFVQVDSRLNRQFEGTGLGLALIRKLADLHGGSVQVESEVGEGSRFTINLPWGRDIITQQEVIKSGDEAWIHEQAGESNMPSDVPLQRGTILLAEDNMASVLTIGEYLESNGYEIVVAHDGLEAVEKTKGVNPDIILMDIQMPALDGLEAIRRLRADSRFETTPIIALTALAMSGDRERCLEAGANEYMSKPVSLKRLAKTIRKLLRQEK